MSIPSFISLNQASVTKGSIRQLLWGVSYPSRFDAVGWCSYELADYLPALKLDANAAQPSRHRPATCLLGYRRVPDWRTLGALALGVLMDKFNPFRVLALSYATGAICIVMIGLSQDGLWLMALAIFGTGIGISGSQVGLNALTANTLSNTKSRHGRELVKRRGPLRRDCLARCLAA